MSAGFFSACLVALVGALSCGCSSSDADADGNGAVYCSSSSPQFAGPSGYKWYLYGNPGACATSTCTANDQRACAKLQSPMQEKAGIGMTFDSSTDLSSNSGIEFTADIKPAGTSFDVGVSASRGGHGLTWALTSQSGSHTYRVGFDSGQSYSNDGVVFRLTAVDACDVGTSFLAGGALDVTITSLSAW